MSPNPLDAEPDMPAPGRTYNVTVTRTLDSWPEGARERVLHQQIVLSEDPSELNLMALALVKAHGGDSYSIRRVDGVVSG